MSETPTSPGRRGAMAIPEASARNIAAGLAVLGGLGMMALGYLDVSTPECSQCTVDLAVAHERLDHMAERLDANEAAIEACRAALEGP